MKSKRKTARPRGLRVLAAAGAAAAPVAASVPVLPPPGPELVGHEENEQRKIAARTKMIDRHRGQRSDLQTRQAREVSELVARHLAEEKQLDRAQAHDLAELWRNEGRPLAGWQVRVLGGAS